MFSRKIALRSVVIAALAVSGTAFAQTADVAVTAQAGTVCGSDLDCPGATHCTSGICLLADGGVQPIDIGSSGSPYSTMTYQVTITNNGPSAAASVALNPTLDPAAKVVAIAGGATDTACVDSNGKPATAFPCTLAPTPTTVGVMSAPPADGDLDDTNVLTTSFTISWSPASLPTTCPGATGLANTVIAVTSSNDTVPTNDSVSIPNITLPFADVAITVTGPAGAVDGGTAGRIEAGGSVPFNYTVTNNGPCPATTVTVAEDSILSGLTFTSGTGACSGGFPCTLPDMNPGDTNTFTSVYAVGKLPADVIQSATYYAADVSADQVSPNPANQASTPIVTIIKGPASPIGCTTAGSAPSAFGVIALGLGLALFGRRRRS